MNTSKPTQSFRGFTLVELLVVIAIIVVLMGIAFPIANKVRETAKRTSAKTVATKVVMACDNFYETYQYLPMSNTSPQDAEQTTNNQFMAPILGLTVAQDENPKFLNFCSDIQIAKGKGDGVYDGLVRSDNRAELVGPWINSEKTDRHYRVLLNYDNDNQLREPNDLGSEILFDRRVLVYHMGKDGKTGGKFNEDNVYSWNKSQ